jgi:NitT/TauT family transport system substrate-binding protein
MISRRAQFLAGAAGTLLATRTASAQTTFPTFRLGVATVGVYVQSMIAIETGLYKKHGITVEMQDVNNSGASMAAVVGGAMDISIGTPLIVANAVSKGLPLVMVAGGAVNTQLSGGALMVPINSPIKTAKDLRGKIVGISAFKQISELGLDIWLEKNGVQPEEVKVTETVMTTMHAALERGTVDAALIGTPMFYSGLKTKTTRILADTLYAIAPRYLSGAWFGTREFATKNPEAMRRFAAAIHESGKWATSHWPEALPMIAKYTKSNLDDLKDAPPTNFADGLKASEVQPLLDAAARLNFIPRPVTFREMVV